jgi:hypothetical protein
MVFNILRIRRIIKVKIAKVKRAIKQVIYNSKTPKNSSDRLIVKIIKTFLDRNDTKVQFSPISDKIYIYTRDRRVFIVFNAYEIHIAYNKFFFYSSLKDSVSEEITKYAKERIESEMRSIESEVSKNQKELLNDLYESFSKTKTKQDRRNEEFRQAQENRNHSPRWEKGTNGVFCNAPSSIFPEIGLRDLGNWNNG